LALLVVLGGACVFYWYRRYKRKGAGEPAEPAFTAIHTQSNPAVDLTEVVVSPRVPSSLKGSSVPAASSGSTGSNVSSVGTQLSNDKIEEIASTDPEKEHKEIKARLRQYELDFEARQGFKPRKRDEWGKMWPDYEKYVLLRKAAIEAKEKKGGDSTTELGSVEPTVESTAPAAAAEQEAAGSSSITGSSPPTSS